MDENWQVARLIPTSGINGAAEQERRATSALLAVLGAVREFGRAVTQPLGAPPGRVETFIEVPFEIDETRCFPDGLLRVTRGQRTWVALVEVKTGGNDLAAPQIETYLEVAHREQFDAVLTISNEIPAFPGEHPVEVDRKKLRTVALHHLSWSQVLAEAVMQKEHRGIADPEQAWILGELIRYLEHPKSGALEFQDMGSSWVPVRDAIGAGTLRAGDRGVVAVVSRFDALLQFAGLRLGRRLGVDVVPVRARRERDPAVRRQVLVDSLTDSGRLTGGLKVPGAVGPVMVTADLRAGKVTWHVDVEAPRAGRPSTRVGWLLRQLATAPPGLRLEAYTAYSRTAGTAELLSAVQERPALLIEDPARELRSFRICLDRPLGTKRGKGPGGFVDSVLDSLELFYGEVVQGLEAWVATPSLREEPEAEPVRPALVATSLSSQDGPVVVATPAAVVDDPAPRPPLRRELRVARPQTDGEPGWCADPEERGRLRWWTGAAWGRDVHDPQA